jgi:hypothetical protein
MFLGREIPDVIRQTTDPTCATEQVNVTQPWREPCIDAPKRGNRPVGGCKDRRPGAGL